MNHFIRLIQRYTTGEGNTERRVMDLSLSDGILWSIYSSMTSSYIVPLTIFLLGSRDPAGLIVGLPLLVVPLSQYFAYHRSKESKDLRKTTLLITLVDRFLWLPIVIMLFVKISFIYDVVFIILFLSTRTFFASFSGTTWTLWVPFLISPGKRNRYFSIRNFYMKIFSVIGYFIGIVIFAANLEEKMQYTILIVIALAFSTASLLIMRSIPSSSVIEEKKVNRSWSRPFIVFLIGISLFTLTTSGLGTYFQYYLIDRNYLALPITYYSVLMILTSFSFIISQIFWGRIANLIGNSKSLVIAGFLFFSVPLILLFYHSLLSAIFASMIIGIASSNASLNIFNEMLFRASEEKVKSVSSYNTVQALSQGGGPIIGNAILIASHYDIYVLFLSFLLLSLLSTALLITYTSRY